MTVKDAMTKVVENPGEFPLNWNTPIAEVYAKCGKALYERRQKRVWMCWIDTPYNGEAPTITVWRDKAKAKAAMEEDISETLANFGEDPDSVIRADDEHAHLGSRVEWHLEEVELHA